MSVVIHVRSSLSGRKEGRDRRIDDRRAERKIIHVHSCIRFPVPGAGEKKRKKKNQSNLSFWFHNVRVGVIEEEEKKSYVEQQMTEEGRAHTWIPEQRCRQDTEVSSHLCLFHFLPFQGESHYSSLASRGHLTINRDKHWWPLTYPWQWPSAEQNQTLALSSKPSWEWRGAPCAGQMASGEGDHGAQWSLAAEIPLRKLGLAFVLTEGHQECRSFMSSRTFKRPNDSKTHFTNKYTAMCL